MTNIHITTTKSLQAGIDLPPTECPFCQKITVYSGWCSSTCSTCGFDTELYLPDNIRVIRYKTGLTRNEIAGKLGYTRATVKNYEWTSVTKSYLDKFKQFVLEFYKGVS